MKFMAIDKNIEHYDIEQNVWVEHEISSVRATSMDEGILNANRDTFLFIIINADNIDYLPKLRKLRETTNDPILIGTTNHTIEEQTEALRLGADFYGSFCGDSAKNINVALTVLNNITERARQNINTPDTAAHHDTLMTLGEKLKNLRKKLNLTLKDQCELLGVSLNSVYRWEHNLAIPRMSTLNTLADFYNVSLEWLLLQNVRKNWLAPAVTPIINDIEQQLHSTLRKLSSNDKYRVLGYIERMCMDEIGIDKI